MRAGVAIGSAWAARGRLRKSAKWLYKGESPSLLPSVFVGEQDLRQSQGREVGQELGYQQAGVSLPGGRFAQPGGVPVDDDGGEQTARA